MAFKIAWLSRHFGNPRVPDQTRVGAIVGEDIRSFLCYAPLTRIGLAQSGINILLIKQSRRVAPRRGGIKNEGDGDGEGKEPRRPVARRRVFSAVHIRTRLNSVSAQTDRLKVSIFTELGVLRKRAPCSLQEVVNPTARSGLSNACVCTGVRNDARLPVDVRNVYPTN